VSGIPYAISSNLLTKLYHFRHSTLRSIKEKVKNVVTYQIIQGRIYRSKEALFPMRCQGIEYFLKIIAKDMRDTEFVVNFHDWPHMNKYVCVSDIEQPTHFFKIMVWFQAF
jgi:hypothetical protein